MTDEQARTVSQGGTIGDLPWASESPLELVAGAQLDQYELLRELGRGGMGQVWAARDTKLGRNVAIKFLNTQRRDVATRFVAEARATAQCSHENIVVIHEVSERNGLPFLVFEYLEGQTLRELMGAFGSSTPLSSKRVIELAIPIVRALARAHELGIVHRDLKPENVFVTRSGTVKVLDFGLAKALREDEAVSHGDAERAIGHLTQHGAVLGTLPYMAPEQLRGEKVDARADLWALGVMLYEMRSGRHPASRNTLDGPSREIEPFVPLREVAADSPAGLIRLVDELLVRDVNERTVTMLDLARRLERMAAGRHDASGDRVAPPNERGWRRRHALPFVGRERELATLDAIFDECITDESARVALILAPAGIGKSRLAEEIVERLLSRPRDEAPQILWLSGEPMSESSPLSAISAGVLQLAGVRHGDVLDVRRAGLRELVAHLVQETDRQRVTEFLGELVHTPFPDEDRPTLQQARRHAGLMADEIKRAFVALIDAIARSTPLVVIVDDIPWVDAQSLDHLEEVLRCSTQSRVFVVGLGRPELFDRCPHLWSEHRPIEMKLHPLARTAAMRVVRGALPAAPEETIARIVDHAAGSPLFLEQLLHSGCGDHLPSTVIAMLQARLGTLPAAASVVLSAASVLGEVFWDGGVDAIAGAGMCRDWAPLLEKHELVFGRRVSRFATSKEFAFGHALLRDCAYAMMSEEQRREAHRRAAAWLEQSGEIRALVLAGHHHLGGEIERAVQWCLTAAEQAFEHDDIAAAEAAATRGLAMVDGASVSPALVELLQAAHATILERTRAHAAPAPAPIVIPESAYQLSLVEGLPILAEVCVGCWSRAFTQQYLVDIKAALSPLLGKPWGKLCNLDAWLPTEPDATDLIIDFLKWSMTNRMKLVAYVISNPDVRLQVRRIAESSNVKVICGWFATQDEALAWLREHDL